MKANSWIECSFHGPQQNERVCLNCYIKKSYLPHIFCLHRHKYIVNDISQGFFFYIKWLICYKCDGYIVLMYVIFCKYNYYSCVYIANKIFKYCQFCWLSPFAMIIGHASFYNVVCPTLIFSYLLKLSWIMNCSQIKTPLEEIIFG